MEEYNEKAFSPKEMSTTLDIGDSTLRKWCIALEKQGYQFIRNGHNNRVYIEADLVLLRHFQQLVKQNMPLDNAAAVVVDRFGKGPFHTSTGIVLFDDNDRDLTRSNDEVIKKLLDYIEKQDNFNQELLERLDQQQKYIDERLNNRDQQLMSHIRSVQNKLEAPDDTKKEIEELKATMKELLEGQKQIAAAQEKKGFLSKLFGK